MKLYLSPGACSLADHIAIHEAGLTADFVKVDLRTKQTEDGADFTRINPKGYVPALELDDGAILTENIAILLYIADRTGKLLPADGLARYRVIEMTAFVSTEVHKNFKPFYNPAASDAEKDEARKAITNRLTLIAGQLDGRDFVVGDAMSIADCYLFVMLMWCGKQGVEVPVGLKGYYDRLGQRPAVREALGMEGLG